MCLRIEPGRPEAAAAAARMIASTDVDLFRCYSGGDLQLWIDLSEWEWRAQRGIYSYTMSQVARVDEELAGVLVSYTAQRHKEIDWSLDCSRPYIAADRWQVLDAVRPLAALLFPAIPDDAYHVQNIVTSPLARGRGLGRRLMEQAFAQGREVGCRSCHLDVDSSTPAVQFYEHLGMKVLVKTEVLYLPEIHTHFRMVIDL